MSIFKSIIYYKIQIYKCIKYSYIHIYVHTHIYTHKHIYTYSYTYIYMYTYYMYTLYVCMYVYRYMYILYMCTHTHTVTHMVNKAFVGDVPPLLNSGWGECDGNFRHWERDADGRIQVVKISNSNYALLGGSSHLVSGL